MHPTNAPLSDSSSHAQKSGRDAGGEPREIDGPVSVVPPVWPLQNNVAVNPFWFLRDRSFESIVAHKKRVHGIEIIMPFEYYRERMSRGEISTKDIRDAINLFKGEDPSRFEFQFPSIADAAVSPSWRVPVQTLSEYIFAHSEFQSYVVTECSKHAAAYLDERQAVSAYPWTNLPFWTAWQKAQSLDCSMDLIGFQGFGAVAGKLAELDSRAAIERMLTEMSVPDGPPCNAYLERLALSILGWATQFRYLEWQRSLGYAVRSQGTLQDLIAVRLCYDYCIFSLRKSQIDVEQWRARLVAATESSDQLEGDLRARLVYQLAMEIAYQRETVKKLQSAQAPKLPEPKAQIVFCIDVRSEMIRRHIEAISEDVRTIGFAGFFGLGLDYQRPGEDHLGHRLPVLLRSSHVVEDLGVTQNNVSLEIMAFLRNLRKNSFSSFLFVELFGAIYGVKLMRRGFSRLIFRFQRWASGSRRGLWKSDSQESYRIALKTGDGKVLDAKAIAEKAAGILQHMGLITSFAPLIVLLGHGSRTENNAFGSALDCGACGGHPGDANARALASFLNDPKVREHLVPLGICIPEQTIFVAGVHETVTDEVSLVAGGLTSDKVRSVEELKAVLREASTRTRQERHSSRSSVPSDPAEVRSQNWSEVRPEWGLAGNACFIVAPRARTRGLSFGSRPFLHDYDWKLDQKTGFKTLELILTAPMVVTNWINLQYYASTVVPEVYGAGNKVLHNLVNETGVIEGNCGDLKFGLPIQSVHDGNKMVHEPLRLSVFVEAPQSEIERIIESHKTVRELVSNGWLHILQIASDGSEIFRRSPSGKYALLMN